MKIFSVLALLLFSGILLLGCTGYAQTTASQQPTVQVSSSTPTQNGESTSQPSVIPDDTVTPTATFKPSVIPGDTVTPTASVQEFSMEAKQWEFVPASITVKKGMPVKLTIKSLDVDHGFALPDFGVSRTLEPGETEIIEFTPDKTGTFTFFCSVFCGTGHKDMKGQLIVTD